MAAAKKASKWAAPRWEKYKSGKAEGKFCPRCGQGIFLAKMKDRLYCGKCQYTEYTKA
jgi:ubiquitin-small subunit ribosomal protein S27Ae